MRHLVAMLALQVCLSAAALNGTVTDPSGAPISGATVEVRGPGGSRRARTDEGGKYEFPALRAGSYDVRVTAKGFAPAQGHALRVDWEATFDVQLAIQARRESVTVEGQGRRVTAEAGGNGSAVVLGEKELAALSDDPDELAMQLQALAGPAPGPNGGQMFIDAFTGGNLPPKSAIREVRINANPYSPEFDRPGFSRVETFTKPGSEQWRGQTFLQYNDRALDSRNPLLEEAPPFRTQFYGATAGGPLKKRRVSFLTSVERRQTEESAPILATVLDANLEPLRVTGAAERPQARTTINPRLDYEINRKSTLVARYQDVRVKMDNQGAGDYNLASRGYDERQGEQALQATETAVLSTRALNETRVQWLRETTQSAARENGPAIDVLGAFGAGGSISGISGSQANNAEVSNLTAYTRGRHAWKWGGRVRRASLTDTSRFYFGGAYTFYSLEEYREGTPSQFRLNFGEPATRVSQADAGLFVNDDWRVWRNLTVSLGLRYEAQTNFGGAGDWAPRIGIAWGLDAKRGRAARTVLRAGAGTFYDRIPISEALNAERYNGVTQQSYLILNPAFYPAVPSPDVLRASAQPQELRLVARGIAAPALYQASVGIERQINQASRLTATWTGSRGVHLMNARNVNAPAGGVYPAGDRDIRLLTESAGASRQNQLLVNTDINRNRLLLFGFYSLSYGRDNNEGMPANPYDLRAEWGPSSYGDLRHRAVGGASITMRWGVTASPFLAVNSGQPFNITTGLDPENTGYPSARPALDRGVECRETYGCFDLQPKPGEAVIERNYGRGPGAVSLAVRVSRTWAFGEHEAAAIPELAGHGGGASSNARHALTLSVSTMNVLNHPNFATPSGNLSSPYFGQPRSLGGFVILAHDGTPSTYNRKIDLQVRFSF